MLLVTNVCSYMYLHAVVRGELLGSSRVPDLGVDHPRGTAELCLGEPKSAHGECGLLQMLLTNLGLLPRHPVWCYLCVGEM